MNKKTGFHNNTSALGAEYIEMLGYDIPQTYKDISVEEQYKNVRENVGMIDLSYLPKIEILGPDAETLCQTIFTRNMKRMGAREVVYTAILNEEGGMLDDGTLFRMCDNTFRFVCGFSETIDHIRSVATKMELKVIIKDMTDKYCNFAIQGPNSRAILEKAIFVSKVNSAIAIMKAFHFSPSRLLEGTGISVVVSRTGYSGELGFEVWCETSKGEEVWKTIYEMGAEYNIKPFGLDALDLLRVEAGLIFGGYEFDAETDPCEAGIGYVAPLKSNPDNFIGRSAFEKRKENPKKRLVGLELEGEVTSGDAITVNGKATGKITSPIFSPIMNKHIAMAFVEPANKEIGTTVEVGSVKGKVVEYPFYEADRKRMLSS